MFIPLELPDDIRIIYGIWYGIWTGYQLCFGIQYATVFESSAWEIVSLSGTVGTWREADGTRRVGAYSAALRRRAPAHALAAAAAAVAVAALLIAATLLPPHARQPLCACAAFATCLW